MSNLAGELGRRKLHPARVVVLLPYAQLMPVARTEWARMVPDGFSPRFETTRNWAGALGFTPQSDDIHFDRGVDLLTARAWLERIGLAEQAESLAGRLVDLAWQLGGVAASVAPPQRPDWLRVARLAASEGAEAPALALEAAIARVAVEWAASSNYATDALLLADLRAEVDALVVLEGLQADPLAGALVQRVQERSLVLMLNRPGSWGAIRLHEAADPSDEAERTAACVVQHLEAGRAPVALAAIDRVLTRRVRAMLDARGVAIRDETGWKLSTTRAAATVMGALRACVWDAGSDAVIDWLKNMPAAPARSVSALERRIRREGWREWRRVRRHGAGADGEVSGWESMISQVDGWREMLQSPRALHEWLQALREVLQATGQWSRLARDAAGVQLLEVLGLDETSQARWRQLPQAARKLGLSGFTAWVKEALEAASFQPAHPEQAQVVILPMHQLLGRPFAALVAGGCDELRLPPSPEPPGPWSAAQRKELGLASREALEIELRAGWRSALQTPFCDVLWRRSDDAGEPVLASPLVEALRLDGIASPGADARQFRELPAAPVVRPLPVASDLPVETLSASAYDDLRRCPYRFYALRQLGLQEAAEIDGELDKRDFGNWLHKVLSRFHEQARDSGLPFDAASLDQVAQQVTLDLGLDAAEFLPFASAWPAVRDGYLSWLSAHSTREGAVFESAEAERVLQLASVKLVGRIDRIDRLPDGRLFVMDYKTEAAPVTAERVRQPLEDTQLGFYAALLGEDSLRAAYVNVGEREGTRLLEQVGIGEARLLLLEGIRSDLQKVGNGEQLPALGEGKVCGFCAARGVCRRDFWHE